jgi:hypothetical protein
LGRAISSVLACAFASAVLASAASAAASLGVADDATKYADDGGATLFARLAELGARENRIAVFWNPDQPDKIQERGFLDRMLPVAQKHGMRIVFSVYPRAPSTFAVDTDRRVQQFANYLRLLAQTYPQVKNYVVLNEPNEAYFWAPQRSGDEIVSARVALRALAAGYDALKSVDPGITVAGLGLSPDANDRTSTSPVRFLDALGRAYRASGRAKPIMDELDVHLYPRDASRHDHNTHYSWPNAGAPDVDRIKQAVWDAFNGTAQPVLEESGQPGPYLKLRMGEIGWQVAIQARLASEYTARENVAVTDEARQAAIYTALARRFACDRNISAFHFFHVIDDRDLIHYQSGLLRADGTARPSFAGVKQAIRTTCGRVTHWSHSTSVDGARATFDAANRWAGPGELRAVVSAAEDANVMIALVRVGADLTRDAADRVLLGRSDGALLSLGTGRAFLKGGWTQPFEFKGSFEPGKYAFVVRVSAATNEDRTTTILSSVFNVV